MGIRRRNLARSEVIWTLICFIGMQIAFVLVLDFKWPEIYDQEYAARLSLVRNRVRECPDGPLLLVVGSSRIGLGFVPEQLPPLHASDGQKVIPFNYGHLAAGPRMNLLQVHRLLREGITPTWLVLEIVPGALAHEGVPTSMAAAEDLPVLGRHASRGIVGYDYFRGRLNPFYKNRKEFLKRVAPLFVTSASRRDEVTLLPLGDDDHWMRLDDVEPDMSIRLAAQVRSIYFERLQDFHIDPKLDGATRELLELCRSRRIHVTLLLTPENSRYRSWYSPETTRRLAVYLNDLKRDFGVRVIDARDWVPDAGFKDPHHMRLEGASIFTERLGREVLRPLVEKIPPSLPDIRQARN